MTMCTNTYGSSLLDISASVSDPSPEHIISKTKLIDTFLLREEIEDKLSAECNIFPTQLVLSSNHCNISTLITIIDLS